MKKKAHYSAQQRNTIKTTKGSATTKLLQRCSKLIKKSNILESFGIAIVENGLVGELTNAKIIFLALISRVFQMPVSVIVKGSRSGGKNTLVNKVLKFFPKDAYLRMTGMSPKALSYFSKPLKHRFLYVEEAAGLQEKGNVDLRCLLSEGSVSYTYTSGGKSVDRKTEGPTGLLLTTTGVVFDEDDTRFVSLEVTDGPEHLREVLKRLGAQSATPDDDLSSVHPKWTALTQLLGTCAPGVVLPFGASIGELMNNSDSRLARDLNSVLGLVKAHALLHMETRSRDGSGNVVATIEDYRVVRRLLNPIISRAVQLAVSAPVRRLVEAVSNDRSGRGLTRKEMGVAVDRRKCTITRNLNEALSQGYLKLASGGSNPKRFIVDDPMPNDASALPTSKAVREHYHLTKQSVRRPRAAKD